jgi:spore germination protein KB
LFTLPLVAIYAALFRCIPGKSLIEISDLIFGAVLGKMVSGLYLFYFLSLCALNTRELGNFVVGYMMPETPLAAIILLFLLACVYALRKGVANMMRLSFFFCVITVGAVAVNSILALKDVKWGFLQPFFQLPFEKYLLGTVSVVAGPMGEIIAFTMILPLLQPKHKAGGALSIGLAFSAVFLAAVLLRDIITLGPLVSVVSLASFESVRYVSLAGILTRMESLYAVVLVILFLFKVAILLYAFVLGLSQLLRFQNPSRLLLISAALVFFYSIAVFESVMENMNWGATAAPFFSLTFEFALPAVSLLVAMLRGLHKKKGAAMA